VNIYCTCECFFWIFLWCHFLPLHSNIGQASDKLVAVDFPTFCCVIFSRDLLQIGDFLLSFWILVINILPRLVVIMSQKWLDCNTFSLGAIVNDSLRPQIPSWCDPEWKGLMESCWSSDPAERPSFTDISQRLRKMAAAMNVKWRFGSHICLVSAPTSSISDYKRKVEFKQDWFE
jgi:hypothetical protein